MESTVLHLKSSSSRLLGLSMKKERRSAKKSRTKSMKILIQFETKNLDFVRLRDFSISRNFGLENFENPVIFGLQLLSSASKY